MKIATDEILSIKKLIRKKGYRFTNQKKIILEELFNVNIHHTVQEIYNEVKDKNVGLATVYRTMNLFAMLGIVKQINVDSTSYYELKMYSKKPLHIHFRCSKCNRIIDIDNKKIDIKYLKLNREIEEEQKIEIFDANIMLIGLCNECSKTRENNK